MIVFFAKSPVLKYALTTFKLPLKLTLILFSSTLCSTVRPGAMAGLVAAERTTTSISPPTRTALKGRIDGCDVGDVGREDFDLG